MVLRFCLYEIKILGSPPPCQGSLSKTLSTFEAQREKRNPSEFEPSISPLPLFFFPLAAWMYVLWRTLYVFIGMKQKRAEAAAPVTSRRRLLGIMLASTAKWPHRWGESGAGTSGSNDNGTNGIWSINGLKFFVGNQITAVWWECRFFFRVVAVFVVLSSGLCRTAFAKSLARWVSLLSTN